MQVIDAATGQPTIRPQLQNPIAEMDVDIIIEDSPDFVSLQAEEFEQLARMAEKGIPVPPEMIIEASSLRNKDRLLESLQESKAMAAQQQMQMMQAQMDLEGMKAQASAQKDMAGAAKDAATVEKIKSEVIENVADAEKTRVETMRLAQGY